MNKLSLRLYEFFVLTKLFIAKIVSIFSKDHFWLISERGTDARDNAYWLFLYIKEKHPEIKAKYVISSDSKDYDKLRQYKNDLIEYRSFSHYVALWLATRLVSTHIMGYTPEMTMFASFDKAFHLFKKQKKVFLQHGITKDDIQGLYYGNVILDLFICGATDEFTFISDKFRYPEGIVKYTGFCRFDKLNDFDTKKQILIMPSWRMYIDKTKFEESEYYKVYAELLQSERLHNLLKEYSYSLIFYPHYEVQKNIGSFKKLSLPENVTIAGFDYDVQTLLKESALLITDFSSVYFDFAYMRKPILFYQFDPDKYHYKPGYFNVENIGKKTDSLNVLLDNLEKSLSKNCNNDEIYDSFINRFFAYRDCDNCKRVFEAIKSL